MIRCFNKSQIVIIAEFLTLYLYSTTDRDLNLDIEFKEMTTGVQVLDSDCLKNVHPLYPLLSENYCALNSGKNDFLYISHLSLFT